MKKTTSKRWVKWLKRTAIAFFFSFVLIFILFCVLIANPFERDYERGLLHLVSPTSEIVVYAPSPWEIWGRLRKNFSLSRIESSPEWREFKESAGYKHYETWRQQKEVDSFFRQIDSLEKKWGIEFEPFLLKTMGRESALALRRSQNRPIGYLLILRVSFWAKVAYGAGHYAIPKDIAEKFSIDLSENIKNLRIPGVGSFYFTMHRDVLFFSNQKEMMEESCKITISQAKGIAEMSGAIPQKRPGPQEIFVYGNLLRLRDAFGEFPSGPLKDIFDTSWGTFDWGDEAVGCVRIEDQRIMGEAQLFLKDARLLPLRKESSRVLFWPKNVFSLARLPIDWEKAWPGLFSRLPKQWAEQVQHHMARIDHREGKKDYLLHLLSTSFQKETWIALSQTDFIKQGLSPLDPYPAASLVIKTGKGKEMIQTIETVLSRIKEETIDTQFSTPSVELYSQEEYAGHKFLRLKFPDVSGGAIHPAIGAMGNYFIVTTHVAFLKSIADVMDGIEPGLDKQEFYQDLESFSEASSFVLLDGERGGKVAYEIRSLLAEFYALHNKKARHDFHRFQKNTEARIIEALQFLNLFKTAVGMDCHISEDKMTVRIGLLIKIRR